VHAIFSTKDRRPFLRSEEIRNEIYAYMAGTLKNLDFTRLRLGDRRSCSCLLFIIEEHCFLRFNWPSQGSIIKTPQREGAPWLWVAEWIRAFSVSECDVESVTAYIVNQAEHHKKFSYQEEIREIFKRHRVAFDERYVWD
jgi:hypothetical protein